MSVTKSLNIQGISIISFDDAVKTAFMEVSQSIDHIFNVEVISLSCAVRDNQVYEYIADTKIYFKVDSERKKSNETDRN